MKGRTRFTVRLIVMLLVVGLLFGAVFGFGAFKNYEIGKFLAGFGNQSQTVATIKAQTSAWQPSLSSVGSLVAVNGADLSPQVAGVVQSINFESGADVKQGDVLLVLAPNNDPAVLAQLQATADLDQVTLARDTKQFAADAISKAQVDTDRANVATAGAQVKAQQALIAEKTIRAPFSGRLGIREVNLGQFLAVGTTIVTLQQLNPLFVDFYLPQQSLSNVAVGQTVNVAVDAFPGQSFAGQITALNAAVDTATRSIQVRARIANDDERLRPGMFATVSIGVGATAAFVTLPQTAISYNPYGDTVFLVHQDRDASGNPVIDPHSHKQVLVVQEDFVTTGDTRGDQVAITKGVAPGDIVVTAGQLKLHNGSAVVINNTIQPPNDPNPTPPNE
jgi:membrane fusion protein (multidrug efflux system)